MQSNLYILFLAITFSLIACSTSPLSKASYADQASFCPKVTQKTLTTCNRQKGTLQKQGKAGCYTCTISYADAGKPCKDTTDCMGGCYNYQKPVPMNVPNQMGVCARNNIHFGCHQEITNGVAADAMICID